MPANAHNAHNTRTTVTISARRDVLAIEPYFSHMLHTTCTCAAHMHVCRAILHAHKHVHTSTCTHPCACRHMPCTHYVSRPLGRRIYTRTQHSYCVSPQTPTMLLHLALSTLCANLNLAYISDHNRKWQDCITSLLDAIFIVWLACYYKFSQPTKY